MNERQVGTLSNDERLWRLTRRLGIALVLMLVVFAAFYAYDRYGTRVESPMDQAVRALEAAVRQNPNDADLRLQTAGAYVRQKQYDRAIKQYQEALKLRENWLSALMGMAAAESARGNDQQAEVIYRQLADTYKDNEFRYSNSDLGTVYYRLALFTSRAGKHDEAAFWAKEALQVDRTDADALYLLASAEEAQGNMTAARDGYRQAVAFDPNFREGLVGLQRAATALGDRREAAYARGMELLAAGDLEGSLKTFQQLVREAPDYAEAHLGLGLAFGKKGQRDEARQAFQAALERNPNLLLAQWSLRSPDGK